MIKVRVLVVEDEAIIAKDLQWRLEGMGYEVPYVAASGEEAVAKTLELSPDLVLMDIMLLGTMDGIEAADRIRSQANIPIIYLTAYADDEILERAKITEPFGYLVKPIGDRELHSNIEITLYKHNLDERLKESQKWLSTVISSIGDAVIATDTNGNVKFMNPVAETLTGWEQNEAHLKPLDEIFNIIDEKTGEKTENPVHKILRDGTVMGLANHTVLITKSGARVPIDNSGSPIKDEQGNITGIVLVFSDISERRKAEAQILQAKQDWENTFNTITDMITVHDKDFNIIRANKAAEKILGLPLLESSTAKCFKYYHGTECPPERCPSCQSLKTGKAALSETFEPHLNMFIEIRAIPRFDENNQVAGLIHVARDITARKQIEEEIMRAKAEWEMTFDNATEFIILIDRDAKIIRCNKSFAEFIGKPFHDIVGNKCTSYFPYDCLHNEPTEQSANIEVQTDSGHWLYLSVCPIMDDSGGFLHAVIIATDITALKYTQQRLTKSEEELKTRVKELEDFYDMAVGREVKMKTLKEEIAKLNKKLERETEKNNSRGLINQTPANH